MGWQLPSALKAVGNCSKTNPYGQVAGSASPCTSTANGRAECFLMLACSAKALSKYSEMVDGIIRQQKDRLEAASDEARAKLREWDMPDALHVSCLWQHLRSGCLVYLC